ncbi:MAG: bacterioferritin [Pseudomonadota bacterium]
MRGDKQVVDYLNRLLAAELAAVDQYFVHSRMYQNWGLSKLEARISHEMQDELGHADLLIKRILFLEATPVTGTRTLTKIGRDVEEMLKNDLDLEFEVAGLLKEAMAHCEKTGDYQTRAMLQTILTDTEEDHILWLQTQLGLIGKIGLQNYQQAMM